MAGGVVEAKMRLLPFSILPLLLDVGDEGIEGDRGARGIGGGDGRPEFQTAVAGARGGVRGEEKEEEDGDGGVDDDCD